MNLGGHLLLQGAFKTFLPIAPNQQLKFGEKTSSELQNENGNYGMVKMNSETTFYSHLIIFNLNLLLWLWFCYFFIMKLVFLIHFMLFWIGLTADEYISRADLFQEWFDHKA